ncbi:MAG: dethiobiotin synthase [Thiogranum sp.]|nr:dethiobiotin synthase [Thiogranum sp.]
MKRGWFITGTDTGIGKTCVSVALLRALKSSAFTTVAMKPVASGCIVTECGLRNDDAERLLRECTHDLAYELVNPYAFEPAIAPHIAADAVGAVIEIPHIVDCCRRIAATADAAVVEGVGGWLVPVSDRETMQDVAVALGYPVILVVGIRLGCLNHALLTAAAVRAAGLSLAGWVANRCDGECVNPDANVRALQQRLEAPLIADFPFIDAAEWPQQQHQRIDLKQLLTGRASS